MLYRNLRLADYCLDIAAKASGVPVYALFGGPFREKIDIYWSHCGTFRVTHAEFFERVLKKPRLTKLDDMRHLGQEAVKRGYKAVKTNPVIFEAARACSIPVSSRAISASGASSTRGHSTQLRTNWTLCEMVWVRKPDLCST
jgi:hypothetical protein